MKLNDLAALLGRSARTVIMTGAGISTESGLPDFRSPTGLWAGTDPAEILSLRAFYADPERFFRFYRDILAPWRTARPNAAHRALAALERNGLIRSIITQNIDSLHQAAGSRRVIELHGNLRYATCPRCGKLHPIAVVDDALAGGTLPRCVNCADLIKPDVVLFDENLPDQAVSDALAEAGAADLMLVIGSSLTVGPANQLPGIVLGNGHPVVLINLGQTTYDQTATATFTTPAGPTLTRLCALLGVNPAPELE
ncbi:MAG: SIR2 family NAD-dependent protein deacylase [Chloroflexota bacterium]